MAGLYPIVRAMPNRQHIFAEHRPALGDVTPSPFT